MTTVWCTFQVVGFHQWPDAPKQYAYLQSLHRHVFHIRVEVVVTHGDRDIEFIDFKQHAETAFRSLGPAHEQYPGVYLGARSCEHIAVDLYKAIGNNQIIEITVSEDKENGATVRFIVSTNRAVSE